MALSLPMPQAPGASRLPAGARAVSARRSPALAVPEVSAPVGLHPIVRWAFYLSVFAIPFSRVYVPGTGDHLGVQRLVQGLMLWAVLVQPQACVRFLPLSLLWFLGYCVDRLVMGYWLAPELAVLWLPSTLGWVQYSLPWVWFLFNVLQFPNTHRGALWAFVAGCALCALLHVAGIGTMEVPGATDRSTVFGENANVVGGTYALGIVALVGLGMLRDTPLAGRVAVFPLLGLLAGGLAKTASRGGILIVAIGLVLLLLQAKSFLPRFRRYGALLLMSAVLAGVVLQIPTVVERLRHMEHSSAQSEARMRMAPVLWEMFLRSPVHGLGPQEYQFELTRRAMPYMLKERKYISAHNTLLMLLVETGVIGFLLYGAGFGAALVSAWRVRHSAAGWLPAALLVPIFLCALTIGNPSSALSTWFALAYALAGGKAGPQPQPEPPADLPLALGALGPQPPRTPDSALRTPHSALP